jgi:hypothetical protein
LHPPSLMNYTKKSTAAGWNDPPMLSTSAPIQVIVLLLFFFFFSLNKLYKKLSLFIVLSQCCILL